jgi:hypothetical protein
MSQYVAIEAAKNVGAYAICEDAVAACRLI